MERDREVLRDPFHALNAVEVVKKDEQRDGDDEDHREVRHAKRSSSPGILKQQRDSENEEIERRGDAHAARNERPAS